MSETVTHSARASPKKMLSVRTSLSSEDVLTETQRIQNAYNTSSRSLLTSSPGQKVRSIHTLTKVLSVFKRKESAALVKQYSREWTEARENIRRSLTADMSDPSYTPLHKLLSPTHSSALSSPSHGTQLPAVTRASTLVPPVVEEKEVSDSSAESTPQIAGLARGHTLRTVLQANERMAQTLQLNDVDGDVDIVAASGGQRMFADPESYYSGSESCSVEGEEDETSECCESEWAVSRDSQLSPSRNNDNSAFALDLSTMSHEQSEADEVFYTERFVAAKDQKTALTAGSKYYGEKARQTFFQLYHDEVPVHSTPADYIAAQKLKRRNYVLPLPMEKEMEGEELLSARKIYIQKCEQLRVTAKPVIIRRNMSTDLNLKSYGLLDSASKALAKSLNKLPVPVRSLDLTDNGLREKGAEAIATALQDVSVHVEKLNLSNNRVGTKGIKSLENLLRSKASKLTELNLAANKLGDTKVKSLIESLLENTLLSSLNLSDNLIGETRADAGKSLALLLRENRSITDLNLSWNLIRGKSAIDLLEALNANVTLTSLNLAWNSLGKGEPAPAVMMAEILPLTYVLRRLDLSNNHITAEGAFVLADGLQYNKSLQTLILDGNPIDMDGIRAVVRAIHNNHHNKLDELGIAKCQTPIGLMHGNSCFDPQNSEGFYRLDMSKSYDRIVLAHLFELAVKRPHPKRSCFSKVSLNDRPYALRQHKTGTSWQMPNSGKLEFDFLLGNCANDMSTEDMSITNLASVSDEQLQSFCAILTKANLKGEYIDSDLLVSALVCDFVFTSVQACQIITTFESSDFKLAAAARLYPLISDRPNRWMITEFLEEELQTQLEHKIGASYSFIPTNPTGHYMLDLADTFDRQLALRIIQLNSHHRSGVNAQKNKSTMNKHSDENFRNEKHAGLEFTYNSNWQLPNRGIFEFDYVSPVRPPSGSRPMSDSDFSLFVRELTGLACSIKQKIITLRSVTEIAYFSAAQLAAILQVHDNTQWRIECYVALYSRIVDEEQLDVAMSQLTACEQDVLRIRLGYLNMFNPVKPDGRYICNLAIPEQRVVLELLYKLAQVEGGSNFHEETVINDRPLEFNPVWLKNLATTGTYICRYETKPGTESMTLRRQMGRDIGWHN